MMAISSPNKSIIIASAVALFLNGCASADHRYQLEKSYLEGQPENITENSAPDLSNESGQQSNIAHLTSMQHGEVNLTDQDKLAKQFGEQANLAVSVDNMTVKSFIHYALSEMLGVDYILGNDLPEKNNITLNITNKISPRKLFSLTQQMLQERGLGIRWSENIYHIYQMPQEGKESVIMGFGRETESIPQNSGQILQVVPLKYGIRVSVERTLNGLIDASITPDFEQSALFIKGTRDQIVRAIDLIKLLDIPSNRGKHIALISPVYISVENFIETSGKLLKAEGVEVGSGSQNNGNLLFVPLAQLGAVAVFSAEQELLERVEYWAKQIDKPSKGTERQYHIYTPRFARASDLAESIAPLISGSSYTGVESSGSSKDNKDSAVIAKNTQSNKVSSNSAMTMVVDKRSNVLIFHASGTEYQSILPLVQRMDIMPKQVLLSVTIAEIKMTGAFKRGFEFAVKSGNFSGTTKGSLGIDDIGGLSLNWASGIDLNQILSKFSESNSQVNILSKPTLLVRDGTEANIDVGDKIPVNNGSTLGANNTLVTQNVGYQETGIKLRVTPTVNAQGVVIMKIAQDISNQVADTVGVGGNPLFFQRSISTEVVADSGQTILLGGLISENSSNSDSGVPGLKSIPLLGGLFESASKNREKTELVILVTPKIVERSDQWQVILNNFQQGLENLTLQ